MADQTLAPICAFDFTQCRARPVADDWPAPTPGDSATFRWLHLDLGKPETRRWIEQNVPPIAASALLQAETRPRCDLLGEGLILNLRGVNLNPGSNIEDMVSLRMWILPNAVISSRTRRIWATDEIQRRATEGTGPATVGGFLAELLHGLSHRIELVSLELDDQTDGLEERALEGASALHDDLGALRLTVIKMRRFLHPQREALDALLRNESRLLDASEITELREAVNRTRRTIEELDATRDRLVAVQDQIASEQVRILGRNSFILSIVAAVFLPLGFLTGLFGVNIAGMPGTQSPLAFWFLSGGSLAIGLGIFLVFRALKWL
ncbi:zinc transporter ZntB [Ruegeria sp. PrR005]|uniref:Zinc transporter ZntB n=1 Tax=Ruegeria sp. PrR005 TaxID=2706882 RepID=A0A6B2NYR7_9RHOB|nr:zinc transporter ZntB [Ruegeria sp. PrR005]NDW47025.1 zinc transporter ZntB [Ruegeria sp. PrR005]